MASTSDTTHRGHTASGRVLGRAFCTLRRGLTTYIENHSRADQIAALSAKSDAELAAMGLRRDEIVSHVFRDRFLV